MVKEIVVYQIRNIKNGKIYIGSTIDYVGRQKRHLRRLTNGNHHSIILQRSWDKHGSDNFIFEVLEIIYDKGVLLEREQYYLDMVIIYVKLLGVVLVLNIRKRPNLKWVNRIWVSKKDLVLMKLRKR